ncbi:protocatechuate 3,4-dioxygenase subunit alpha [Hutsoniella sourekii]|uniref:protocatechuate 3,4-dioxygenase subunit alpha n=1 Tax=Hutsoniella sourekii TaxID=87650 RepID=UPI0004BA4731|nr:protocatechuate 3,4-dioxygenase subunit alpha [Hutsoniella sourekii]
MAKINKTDAAIGKTPQQTVGPYVTLGLLNKFSNRDELNNDLTEKGGSGEKIIIEGNIMASDNYPMFNVMVEIWQANSKGVFNHSIDHDNPDYDPSFVGFGRAITNRMGHFEFKTFKPGPTKHSNHFEDSEAPHIMMIIHSRGVAHPLATRIYFEDENTVDDYSKTLTDQEHQGIIAKKVGSAGMNRYHIDIVLDGTGKELLNEPLITDQQAKDLKEEIHRPVTHLFVID